MYKHDNKQNSLYTIKKNNNKQSFNYIQSIAQIIQFPQIQGVAFHLQSVITITFELQSKTIAIVLLFYHFANTFSVYTQVSTCQLPARHTI